MPINVAALTIFAQAVFGVVIAALWLRERLHWGQVWGSAAIVVGLVVGCRGKSNGSTESWNDGRTLWISGLLD